MRIVLIVALSVVLALSFALLLLLGPDVNGNRPIARLAAFASFLIALTSLILAAANSQAFN